MAAIQSVEFVVRAHYGTRAGIDAALEMGQVDLPQCALVHGDIDMEARILHAVGREMLGGGHDVVVLHPARQRRPHLAQQERVLAIGFLCSPPSGVSQEIDADASEQISSMGTKFSSDGVADSALEFHVKAGAPSHGDGEAGGVALRDAPGSIVEEQVRNSQALVAGANGIEDLAIAPLAVSPMREKAVAREHVNLLVQVEVFDPSFDLGFLLSGGRALLNRHFSPSSAWTAAIIPNFSRETIGRILSQPGEG